MVFPEPEGPTKATVSPRSTSNETPVSAGAAAVWWVKPTFSNSSEPSYPNAWGLAGFASRGRSRIA